ncbi:MAG: amidohydrolase family protein [Planctomycetota bacterium]|nr:MAG: amidohydrolase family protein [Planctomycetota bacterium]
MEVPGLIDLQVNGYKGVNFSSQDLTEDDFVRACRQIIESGTTAFLPTLISSPKSVYEHNLPIIAQVCKAEEFHGHLLGIHLEGPFISSQDGARGAHMCEYVKQPDIAFLQQLIDWANGTIKLITVAAEAKGAEQLAQYALERGIVVSLGHQMAGTEDLDRLVNAGATSLTHLGNALPEFIKRHKNPLWAALANDSLTAMFVTDGHHLPPEVLKTIIRTKSPECCIVVSDCAPLAGAKPGRYQMMGQNVILEKSGRLYNPDAGYLVGSSATIIKCMNYLASLNLVTADELIAMGFYNPLRLISVNAKHIAKGRPICFDEKRNLFYLQKS